jgi:hypothetical protein
LSRLCFGAVALLVYLPLLGNLNIGKKASNRVVPSTIACNAPEEAKL